ncbi:ferric uptake regulation protein [candidate division WOR-1 bacterium DG_54_3]|uniref:Ferric uptake regulation protein n=1 Tax=candidate division WOR-1 bacterium DG_54_3 TaxID=1703775 RepID=A0A0S7Y570_UNCSA|nr:MAG: ferric uptake regulation protein [candidate division WOR-1 bacterium DG_54_3]
MPGPHKWRHRFQGSVSRWTMPREVILEYLSRTSKHMSAKEIYAHLHRMYPGIGLTTIYRTLDLLVRLGLINKFEFGDGQSRYEFKSDKKKEHHHHLICTKCGKIIDYSNFVEEELQLVKKTEEELAKKYNFAIQDHNIEFLGLCEKCKKASSL